MHDAKGRALKVGDIVLIPAKVTNLSAGEDYCNVGVETVFGRRPDEAKEHIHAINTGVLLLASAEPDVLGPMVTTAETAVFIGGGARR